MSGRRRARTLLPALALATAVAIAVPALGANHTEATDGNDTAGLLDVREVRFDHNPAPRWTFETFARWTLERLWDRGYLVVRLDTRGDAAVDVLLVLRSDGRDAVATLVRITRTGREIEQQGPPPRGRRTNGRSIAVEVALRKLAVAANRDAYYWSAFTIFTGTSCSRTCLDRIPDRGRVEQLLPGTSPSPTPTPTPTPTPMTGPA